jgi:iron complex transport system permease protein
MRCLAIPLAALGLALGLLLGGSYGVTPVQALQALAGGGDAALRLVVLEWRLPRAALALLLGAALGLSGAIFQALTRNPLGSPDILGLDAGGQLGALAAALLLGGGAGAMGLGALGGALGTAAALLALAGGQGPLLVVAGIGLHAMLTAASAWLLLRASPDLALGAALWGAGSLSGRHAGHVLAAAIGLALLLPLALALQRPLRALELGEEIAAMQGVPLCRLRGLLLGCGIGLTALSCAIAGPIAFIALCAPPIARRVTGRPDVALLPAAAMGAALLAAAESLALRLPVPLPTGVVTAGLGGAYFLWLIIGQARRA